jgi:hypothetical protein
MNAKIFLYGLWCLGIVGTSLVTSYYAWSPFSDGGTRTRAGFYGPSHK